MKTIEYYENLETTKLQKLLKKLEDIYETNELSIDNAKIENHNYYELERENKDYEIDIRLIRMELNKRLWYEL